jgi:hypothetical protein
MAKISILALAVVLGFATGALAQAAGGVGVTSSPPSVGQIPPSFFGPFHTNMPMVMGPGPADNLPAVSGLAGAGTTTPGMAGLPWALGRGGVGATPQPLTGQTATTAQPAATAGRTAPAVMFRRFGR